MHWYGAFYFCVMLVWPFEPSRFLVPWVPFMLFWTIEGLTACCDYIRKRLLHTGIAAKGLTLALSSLLIGVAVLYVSEDSRMFADDRQNSVFAAGSEGITEREKVVQWVKGHTSLNDVIASGDPAFLYLRTGRKGFPLWPVNDPYQTLYNKERSWTTFYDLPARSEMGYVFQEIRSEIADTYSKGGVRWVIVDDHAEMTEFVLSIVARENPQDFQLAYGSPGGRISVYRYLQGQ
jgi:hypothetical protein